MPVSRSARYYDLDVAGQTADIAMYLALASASDGAILELGCGTGRVSIPLAQAGHDVTGVDRDAAMLARAADAWDAVGTRRAGSTGSLDLVQADMTNVRLGRRFDLVVLAFNTLLMVPGKPARGALFDTIRVHLSDDGRAVIDVWLPTRDDLELYDGRLIPDWSKLDPETGEQVTKTTIARIDGDTRRATVETMYQAQPDDGATTRVKLRDEIEFLDAGELLSEMESAGLQPQALGGDYSMAEFTPQSDRLIVLAARSVPRDYPDRTNRKSG